MNLPNLITFGRILLVPLTVWLIISEAYGYAFLSFVVAGVSDGIDGFLARRYNMRTELGAYLDPLADKSLMISTYVTLAYFKALPAWLAITVVSRDVLIVVAIVLSSVLHRPVKVAPLMLSKVNTVAQIAFVVAVLGALALGRDFSLLTGPGALATGVLTVASGAAYLFAWLRHMAAGQEGPGAR